jgi:UDP-glucose 4-epimerase
VTAARPRRPVVVVGGAGFVGSNLVKSLVESGRDEIMVIDNFLSSNKTDVLDLPGVAVVEGSIADDDVLRQLPDAVDTVFHLATYHGNQSSICSPLADHQNNLLTTLKLFDKLSAHGSVRRVVYASAGCTVAEKTYGPARLTREDDPVSLHLDSPYQISKIAGEMYANYFHARHGLPVVVARFQNVYGPGEILGAGRWRGTPETVWRNVTPTFIYRAIKGLPLRLENRGRTTRDFIYVDDIVRGLRFCASKGRSGQVYNLASGVETTIHSLARAIGEAIGRPPILEMAPRRTWDRSGRRMGDPTKARESLGFEAAVDLPDGIARTVAWTIDNLESIDASIAQHADLMRRSAS